MSQYSKPYAVDWTTPDKIGGKEPAQPMGGLRKLELDIDDIYTVLNDLGILYYGTSAPANPEAGRPWLDSTNMPAYAELKYWDGSAWVTTIKVPDLTAPLNAGAHPIYFTLHTYTGVVGTTTIDWTKGNKAKFTFGAGDETLAFTAPGGPCSLTLMVVQDSVGGRNLTLPATVKWLGVTPNFTDGAASKTIILSFFYDGASYWAQATDWEA